MGDDVSQSPAEGPSERVVHESARTGDNVHLREFDASELRQRFPQWEHMSDAERYERMRMACDAETPASRRIEPTDERHSHNVTTIGLAQTVVRCLDMNQQAPHITHLALGRVTEPAPTFSDTQLGDEQARIPVTRVEDGGDTLVVATFISSTQANGVTIREVGLFADVLVNRALIDPYEKTSGNSLVIEVALSFVPESGVT